VTRAVELPGRAEARWAVLGGATGIEVSKRVPALQQSFKTR